MSNYNIEPWPSTYRIIGDLTPQKLTSKFNGRKVGAFRVIIPPKTMEPPQIHLTCARDGNPFEELLTAFDKEFLVIYFDIKKQKQIKKIYSPGQNIIIPEYQIHWLVNKHDTDLEITCEYAPHPWNGDEDEPEFQNLEMLLQLVESRGLIEKVIENSNF